VAEQVQQTGDHQTNVCSMVPERQADAMSEVLNSKNVPSFKRIIG